MFIGQVRMCDVHYQSVLEEMTKVIEQAKADALTALVYYLIDPAIDQIKIGTTTRFRKRFNTHRKTHPEIMVLAVEPGTYDLEDIRQEQFREWCIKPYTDRLHRCEWYFPNKALLEHVIELRGIHKLEYATNSGQIKGIPSEWIVGLD